MIFDKNYKPSIPIAVNETNQNISLEIIDDLLSKDLDEKN